jgi:hypothetical protein
MGAAAIFLRSSLKNGCRDRNLWPTEAFPKPLVWIFSDERQKNPSQPLIRGD